MLDTQPGYPEVFNAPLLHGRPSGGPARDFYAAPFNEVIAVV